MIPKIIHQTWKDENIPLKWKDAVESCKIINNDFEYKLWTDKSMEEFVLNEYPKFYETYKSYKYQIQRCDAFRYLMLYKYGGCYLDLDIICKKKIQNLINLNYDLYLVKSYSNKFVYTNSFLMVAPNHPFFKFAIDHLPSYVHKYELLGKHLHVMNSAGPLFLTDMVKLYSKENKMKYYILTKAEFAGDCNLCNEGDCNGGEYFNHLAGNSWHNNQVKCNNFIYCNAFLLTILLILIVCLIILLSFFFQKKKLFKKKFDAKTTF